MKYLIVTGNGLAELENGVNALLDDGWTLHGGTLWTGTMGMSKERPLEGGGTIGGKMEPVLAQPMVKEEVRSGEPLPRLAPLGVRRRL